MMRGPSAWSVAVRKPDGVIAEVNRPVTSILLRHRWLRVPIVRGIIALGESLSIGFRALAISANYAAQEEGEDGEVETELTRGQLIFAFGIAIGFALLLFKVSPALITNWLPIDSTGAFVVVEGLVRVTIFIVYLLIISMLPDLKRVFQYHAAEHKAINAYEAGEELTPENVQRYSLLHVRCGTAFLLYVMVVAIFVFAFVGRPNWYWLIISRILLLPVIAGIAYEIIRFAGRHATEPHPACGARARSLASAPHDARALSRPGRGLDSRSPRGAPARGPHHPRGAQSRSNGLAEAWAAGFRRATPGFNTLRACSLASFASVAPDSSALAGGSSG